ncbi:MAG: thioredoxin domain-containing protein [Candidatus Pacebacteria bacterium]|nr:thioredoxin domain-containing protein [Candidatus Paceibacterota bacterium]
MAKNSKYSFDNFLKLVNNNFILIVLTIAVFATGFYTGSNWNKNSSTQETDNVKAEAQDVQPAAKKPSGPTQEQLAKVPEVTKADHVLGAKKPVVTLIEYSDYECPYCNQFHPTAQKIVDEYPTKVAWVYRHFPLGFHENAQDSAEFSECVAKYEGNEAFWQFSEILFEKMEAAYTEAQESGANSIDSPAKLESLVELANDLGWNSARLKTCVEEEEMKDVVNAMEAGGKEAGVSGTPGTVIKTTDGKYELLPGALPYESLKQTVEKYLE